MSGLDGTYDVAIIGLGPVGGTLANILGGYGIKTVILERQPIAYHLPRAVSFDDEICGSSSPLVSRTPCTRSAMLAKGWFS